MRLTDIAIRRVKLKNKPFRLADGKGLALLVKPNGAKYWQFRYRFANKGKLLSLGVYPEVTLAEARDRCYEARKQLSNGADPGEVRRLKKFIQLEAAANSFEAVGLEWFSLQKAAWSEGHAKRNFWLLEKNLLPWLGRRPISEITAPGLLATLRRIESRGAIDTAKRAKQLAGQVFRFAIATGRVQRDPSQDLKGALAASVSTHRAAITEPKEVGPLLLMLDSYEGSPVVRAALRLAPLTFVHPGELRKARWSEIDFETAEWRITPDRMKKRQPHIVPLSRQALAVLRDLHPLTGRWEYVFPGGRSTKTPMSENAVLAAMRYVGISKEEMCGHGFRAMARTILDEVLGYRVDWIEHQLAHAVRDVNGRAYNRTAHLAGRREMMQGWADYLDTLREQASGRNVVKISTRVSALKNAVNP